MVGHGHCFGETLRFVVNAARPDRIDVAPVIFLLWMHQRIPVSLRCRCEDERRFFVLGQAERVMRTERPHLQSWNRKFEIIDRTGRRREVKDVIDFLLRQENEVGNVVLDEFVILIPG